MQRAARGAQAKAPARGAQAAARGAQAKAAARGAKAAARGAQAKRAASSAQSTAKAKRRKQQEAEKCSLVTLENAIKLCRQHGVGCRYCAGNCLLYFQSKIGDLRKWRTEFRNLPDEETRDMHIYWMFCQAPQLVTRQQQQQGDMGVHCETSSDEADFKTSGEEDVKTSSDEAGEEVDAKAGFNTSSSDNDEPNSAKASSSSAKPAPAKPARISAYAIAVLGKGVCLKAAAKLLGIGNGRLDRVRRGEGDGRRLPMPRGPAGMTLIEDSPTTSCLTFLWRARAFLWRARA